MKSVELFVGAGGLALGVGEAGFKPALVMDWDKWACDTLKENKKRGLKQIKGWPIKQGDVSKADFRRFEDKVALVTGGPPCQPFSLGGLHRANLDKRDMFPQAIRAVREIRPRAFMFENVKGLTRDTFRNYLEYIRLQLRHPEIEKTDDETWANHLARLEDYETEGKKEGLHYNVVMQVVNAANFGVPQRRERVFIVGMRSGQRRAWHFPRETHSREALLWDKWRSGDYWDRHGIAKKNRVIDEREQSRALKLDVEPDEVPWVTVRDAISHLPDPELQPGVASDFHDHKLQPGARSYPGHTGSPLDEPAKTLKAGVHGVPGGENMLRRPDGSVRYFTIRESALIQTFPDDMTFKGSWTETMRQLGNAVPCHLAAQMAQRIKSCLLESA